MMQIWFRRMSFFQFSWDFFVIYKHIHICLHKFLFCVLLGYYGYYTWESGTNQEESYGEAEHMVVVDGEVERRKNTSCENRNPRTKLIQQKILWMSINKIVNMASSGEEMSRKLLLPRVVRFLQLARIYFDEGFKNCTYNILVT